jgi:type VI protein secretion system component VasF
MGIFFKAEPLHSAIAPVLKKALETDPKTVPDLNQAVEQQTNQIAAQARGTFSWLRFLIAVAILALLFFGTVHTGRDPALKDLYMVLVHGLEVGLGGVFVILVGEAAAQD